MKINSRCLISKVESQSYPITRPCLWHCKKHGMIILHRHVTRRLTHNRLLKLPPDLLTVIPTHSDKVLLDVLHYWYYCWYLCFYIKKAHERKICINITSKQMLTACHVHFNKGLIISCCSNPNSFSLDIIREMMFFRSSKSLALQLKSESFCEVSSEAVKLAQLLML